MSSYRLCMMPSRPIRGLPTGRAAASALAVDVLVAVMQCLDAFRVEWDDVAERAREMDGPSHVLAHHRGLDGVSGGGADREYAVGAHEDRGRVVALERLHDAAADRLVADQGEGADGDLAAELIGHRGHHTGDGFSVDRPRGRVRAVGVRDAADLGHGAVDV